MASVHDANAERAPYRRVLLQIFGFASAGVMVPWLLEQAAAWI